MRFCQYLFHSEYRDLFRTDDMDHDAGQVGGSSTVRKMDNKYQQL